MPKIHKIICLLCLLACFSCASVKPYERQFLNDAEMQMGRDGGKNFQQYVQSIREGAAPAGSNKATGGCGCN